MAIIIKKVKTNDDKQTFKLAKKKNQYDEYVVRCYQNGKYYEEGSYYTDDWDDAVGTLKDMARRQGLTVRNEGTTLVADSAIKDSLIHDEDLAGYIKKLAYTDGLTTDEIFKRLYKEQPNISAKEIQTAMFYATKNNYAQAEIKKYGFKDEMIRGHFVNAKISEWDPTTLIKRMKETRNGDMHTNLIDKKGNVHTVFLSAWGTIDKAEVWVDVVVETPEGKQDRVFMKKANSWDEALKIMQDYKRQHINDSKPILDAAKAQQIVDLLKKAKATNVMKDAKVNDKSFVEEIIALGREADNARWHFGGGTMDEAKIKKFITAATNSYRYIEQTFMSFMNEVNKNTDENGRWRNPTANIVSIWSNFSNEISSVKEAAYRIIDVLDDITAAASLSDSITRQAAILYKKYKDIYDRIFKSLKK